MPHRPLPLEHAPCHAVRFYSDLDEHTGILTRFLTRGFVIGQPAIVLAAPEVRDRVERALAGLGIDVGAGENTARLVLADARAAVESLQVAGRIDVTLAPGLLGALIDRLPAAAAGGTIRFYGEMSSILWRSGRYVEALEIEDSRADLHTQHRLMTLCGYSGIDGALQSAHDAICAFHTHLLIDSGEFEALE